MERNRVSVERSTSATSMKSAQKKGESRGQSRERRATTLESIWNYVQSSVRNSFRSQTVVESESNKVPLMSSPSSAGRVTTYLQPDSSRRALV